MAYARSARRGRYGNPNDPATEPTKKFLKDLLDQKDLTGEEELLFLLEKQLKNGIKQGTESTYIELLKQLPDLVTEDTPTEPGYYKHDGSIYKVQRAKAGHLYALERDEEGRFKELAKGMMKRIVASELMTATQVKRAGL